MNLWKDVILHIWYKFYAILELPSVAYWLYPRLLGHHFPNWFDFFVLVWMCVRSWYGIDATQNWLCCTRSTLLLWLGLIFPQGLIYYFVWCTVKFLLLILSQYYCCCVRSGPNIGKLSPVAFADGKLVGMSDDSKKTWISHLFPGSLLSTSALLGLTIYLSPLHILKKFIYL